nr:hypothetical protein [Campylobacter jejuni]
MAYWFSWKWKNVYGHIKAQENALIKNILPLEEKLKERKLDKWMERVRR